MSATWPEIKNSDNPVALAILVFVPVVGFLSIASSSVVLIGPDRLVVGWRDR